MLYGFDEADEDLTLLPMAARRALDHAGRKLSRNGWTSLSVERRRKLCALGASRDVDVEAVREALTLARPPAEEIAPGQDPSSTEVPAEVSSAFGPSRPITSAVWSSLLPLDRYALSKIAARGRPDRLAAAYGEIIGATAVSTHLGPRGGARMVDVGEKAETRRTAIATTRVVMSTEAFEKLKSGNVAKGDVLGTARVAGILAAKRTPELIPLCHPIALSKVNVEFALEEKDKSVQVSVQAEAVDRTGVEMEALVGASVAALTIYDMLKSVDRGMTIGPTRLTAKTGGRSGDFSA